MNNLGFILWGEQVVAYYCVCVYWRCKKSIGKKARSALTVTHNALENQNVIQMHASVGATRAEKSSVLGHETVGIQDPVDPQGRVLNNLV